MRKSRGDSLALSLFPFLGVFVCVIGVFAFLDICLFLVSRPVSVRLADGGDGPGRRRQPYVVWCDADSVRVRTPALDASSLRAESDLGLRERLARLAAIDAFKPSDEAILDQVLDDIQALNQHAATFRLPHVGHVVVTVTKRGVGCYWKIAERVHAHRSIGFSAVAVLPGWDLDVGGR